MDCKASTVYLTQATDGIVGNNIPDSQACNFFSEDPDLAALLRMHLGEIRYQALSEQLFKLGQRVPNELDKLAQIADQNPPVLHTRTRRAENLDRIEKHPAFIELEKVAYSELGLASLSHVPNGAPPLVKYALTYLFVQAEFGLCCPVSMTDSLTRTLRKFGTPELISRYLPHLASRDFDELFQGAMFITEQKAGSDVSGVETRAVREVNPDGTETWRLFGDKWFCSNPDADLAMVLARPADAPPGIRGLGLFLLPKNLPDGRRNAYRIIRLKPKLGTRSMASGEIMLEGAEAYLLGEVGRGFHQMADMINMSRLSNGVRAAGLMRRALTEALYISRNRRAFGKRLLDMPLMQRQLMKMTLPTEQARSMFMHTAQLLGRADAGDPQAELCVRILTPLIKFRACRDARRVTGDAMEVRGGLGYIEEWSDARVVRDAHLGSIWEGTSNIVALDIARATKRAGALEPLRQFAMEMLEKANLPSPSHALFQRLFLRACDNMAAVANTANDKHVRQAGSALYNALTALFMACEGAAFAPNFRRLALAHLVARYRLLPTDPMAPGHSNDDSESTLSILESAQISLDQAMAFLPSEASA